MRLRIKELLGWLWNLAGIPPMIETVDHIGIGSKLVSVRVGRLFTIVSVDGYDLYFTRLTGKFDGTGSGNADICGEPK